MRFSIRTKQKLNAASSPDWFQETTRIWNLLSRRAHYQQVSSLRRIAEETGVSFWRVRFRLNYLERGGYVNRIATGTPAEPYSPTVHDPGDSQQMYSAAVPLLAAKACRCGNAVAVYHPDDRAVCRDCQRYQRKI